MTAIPSLIGVDPAVEIRFTFNSCRDSRSTPRMLKLIHGLSIARRIRFGNRSHRAGSNRQLERVKGIEPSYSAWKAAALPLSYTRAGLTLSTLSRGSTKKAKASFPPVVHSRLTSSKLFGRAAKKTWHAACRRDSYQAPAAGICQKQDREGIGCQNLHRDTIPEPVGWRSVAQSARAPVSKTGGWGFESLHSCHVCWQDIRKNSGIEAKRNCGEGNITSHWR